jgi:hypothetical protein
MEARKIRHRGKGGLIVAYPNFVPTMPKNFNFRVKSKNPFYIGILRCSRNFSLFSTLSFSFPSSVLIGPKHMALTEG